MNKRIAKQIAWKINRELNEVLMMTIVLAPIIFSICVLANESLSR